MNPKRRAITVQLGRIAGPPPSEREPSDSDVRPRFPLAEGAPQVLVVDDDDDSRSHLVGMLERIYRVEEADGAPMAIARCASRRPDVILFNADRSDVSSARLEDLLRLALGEVQPPLVVLSDSAAQSQPGDELLCREAEPPDAITLVSLIERALAGGDDEG
jgi:CheY-like chemotaxis protein